MFEGIAEFLKNSEILFKSTITITLIKADIIASNYKMFVFIIKFPSLPNFIYNLSNCNLPSKQIC